MKKLDLEQFAGRSKIAEKTYKLAWEEIEQALSGKKGLTDKTRLASATLSAFSRIMAAEVHRMALEVMLQRKTTKELSEGEGE